MLLLLLVLLLLLDKEYCFGIVMKMTIIGIDTFLPKHRKRNFIVGAGFCEIVSQVYCIY